MTPQLEPLAKKLLATIVATILLGGTAFAQQSGNGLASLLGGIFSGSKPADTPVQQPAVPGTTGSIPWSGEDGASGHPLMAASAIREAAANFDNCVAAM